MSSLSRASRPLLLAALGLVGLVAAAFAVLQRPARRPAPADALPLSCRLRGHGWRRPPAHGQPPLRRTCARCQQIDVPLPR